MVVDDDVAFARTLERICKREGCDVEIASSGEVAVEIFTATPCDVVLTDLRMPGIDGVETLRRLRALDPQLLGIVLTGEPTVESAVDAMRSGAFDYLAKVAGVPEIEVKLRRALGVVDVRRRAEALVARAAGGERALIGEHAAMRRVRELIDQVARAPATPVLVLGENGTGKELVAAAVHARSERAARPLVAVNCAAIPRELLESEFFGHERGSFTGAEKQRLGVFELAQGGTLFLDEIGDMPLELQAKLLRVLEQREYRRVGGSQVLRFDARVIAATNRDLEEEVATGRFRRDLYYRINVFPIALPALSERVSDLPLLCEHFVLQLRRSLGRELEGVSEEALAALAGYDFPGNVRELRNLLERAAIVASGTWIRAEDLALPGGHAASRAALTPGRRAAEIDDAAIDAALEAHAGNKARAAASLGISRFALLRRLRDR